ncbi:DUF305 domain-containing protein [Spirillospora sp. NBC_00431]
MTAKLPHPRHESHMTAKLAHRDDHRTPAPRHHPTPAAKRSRHRVLAGIFFAFVMLLTACGGESKASDPAGAKPKKDASADHNADDVMYLQMMIAHRRQTLDMVRLAPDRSRRGDVQKLAATVEKDSTGELQQMTSRLTSWSKPTTLQGPANSHAAHGGLPAVGAAEMRALKQAEGSGFDTTFLNLLLSLQHNAVEMSQVELKKGVHPTTKTYAKSVMERTSGMISQLLGLLNS